VSQGPLQYIGPLQSPSPGQTGAGVEVWAFTEKGLSNFVEELTSPAKNTIKQSTATTTFLIYRM
jgi:hypothetical protein